MISSLTSLLRLAHRPGVPRLLRGHQHRRRRAHVCQQQHYPLRHASRLAFAENGPPAEVVKMESFDEPLAQSIKDDSVLVRMMLAPVNPADINMIQGTYAIRPDLPAVGGGEGVGTVERVGPNVKGLAKGDWVVPSRNMDGTWSTHMVSRDRHLIKVRSDIPAEVAATIRTNPATAYQMLRRFVKLRPGDVVIQNGSNSAVGRAVVQIAKRMGMVTVNIVRDRDSIQDLKDDLTGLGADYVWTEEELRRSQAFKDGTIPKARLALNCVGGKSATEISKCLGQGGCLVTYGGMSLKPVTVSTSALIFKDISMRGFWLSRQIEEGPDDPDRFKMYEELTQMARDGELTAPKHELVRLEDYADALVKTMKGFKAGKVIFDMR